MAAKKGKAKPGRGATVKPSVKKRTLNDVGQQATKGAPFTEQDVKRRLGDFTGTGEHSRVGRRKTGIVGQTMQQWGTNKKKQNTEKPARQSRTRQMGKGRKSSKSS